MLNISALIMCEIDLKVLTRETNRGKRCRATHLDCLNLKYAKEA